MNLAGKYGQYPYAYLLEVATPVRGDEEIKKLEQEVKAMMPEINDLKNGLRNQSIPDEDKDVRYAEIVSPLNKKMEQVIRVLGSAKKKAVSAMKTAIGKISSGDANASRNPDITAMRSALDTASDASQGPENKQMAYRFKLVNDTLSKMSGLIDSSIVNQVTQSIAQYLNARSAYTFFNTSISQLRRMAFSGLSDRTPDTNILPNKETEERINAEISDAQRKSKKKKEARDKAEKKRLSQERGISRRTFSKEKLLKDVKSPTDALSKLSKILSYRTLLIKIDEIDSKLKQLRKMIQDNPELSKKFPNSNEAIQKAIESIANDQFLDTEKLQDLHRSADAEARSNPGNDTIATFNSILWEVVRDGDSLNLGATEERAYDEPRELATETYKYLVDVIKKAKAESWDSTFLTKIDEYGRNVVRDWSSELGDSFGDFALSDIITQNGKFKNRENIKSVTAKFFMLCMLWAALDNQRKREEMMRVEKRKHDRKFGPSITSMKLPESLSGMTFLQYIAESNEDSSVEPDYDHPKISVGINAAKAIRDNEHPNRNERIQEIADFSKNDMTYGMARRLAVILNQVAYGKTEREADNAYNNFQRLQRQWEATTQASKILNGMGSDSENREGFNDYLKKQWYVPSKEEGEYHNAMIKPLYVGGALGYTKEEIDILKNLGDPIVSGGTFVYIKSGDKTYEIRTTFDHGWLFIKNTENGTIAISTKDIPPTTEGDVRFEYTRGENYSPSPTKRESKLQMPFDVGVVWLPFAKEIPPGFMNEHPNVKLVIMPNVEVINAAFVMCPKLKTVELNTENIEKISRYAFYGCPVDFPPVGQDVVGDI